MKITTEMVIKDLPPLKPDVNVKVLDLNDPEIKRHLISEVFNAFLICIYWINPENKADNSQKAVTVIFDVGLSEEQNFEKYLNALDTIVASSKESGLNYFDQ